MTYALLIQRNPRNAPDLQAGSLLALLLMTLCVTWYFDVAANADTGCALSLPFIRAYADTPSSHFSAE